MIYAATALSKALLSKVSESLISIFLVAFSLTEVTCLEPFSFSSSTSTFSTIIGLKSIAARSFASSASKIELE